MMVMGEGNKIVEREEYKILEVKARHFNVIRVGRGGLLFFDSIVFWYMEPFHDFLVQHWPQYYI
jgi:hypothetical protein